MARFRLPALLIGVMLLAVLLAYVAGRCNRDEFNPDQPPEALPESEVTEMFERTPELGLLQGITQKREPVRRRGVVKTDETIEAAVDFAEAVRDTSPDAPRRFPPVGVETEKDGRLRLGVMGSDGGYEVREFRCPAPCRAGARDTTMFAHSKRQLGLGLFKNAALCAGFAGAGYGVAVVSGYGEPGLVALGAGAGCVLLKIVD